MTAPAQDAPGRWDLDWEPDRHAGRPEREPPSLDASYAEFPLRALAFLLDVLLLYFLLQVASQGRSLLALWLGRDSGEDGALIATSAVLLLLLLVLSLLAVYFWRVFRATPGQLVLGLFVVERGSGRRLRRRALLVRWLLLYLPALPLLAYSSLLDVLFRARLIQIDDPLLLALAIYFLPLAWYVVLWISVLAEGRRGRGLHDRPSGSVVIRRAGPPA